MPPSHLTPTNPFPSQTGAARHLACGVRSLAQGAASRRGLREPPEFLGAIGVRAPFPNAPVFIVSGNDDSAICLKLVACQPRRLLIAAGQASPEPVRQPTRTDQPLAWWNGRRLGGQTVSSVKDVPVQIDQQQPLVP